MAQIYDQPGYQPFKFKSLKVYSSTEWLADNKKKYRQVFDRNEISYVYAELSFYNKFYDHENWEVKIQIRCYELNNAKKKICSLDIKRKVSKFDNVVFVREGWGNKKEGAFWKTGTYFWEAWIEGEKVASKYFYVEDPGENEVKLDNPFVRLNSLKLYEGQYDDVNEDDRTYLNQFSSEESRYIYAEIVLDNLVIQKSWHCELFIKFYNESRELKGQVTKLHNVKVGENEVKISAGWGTNVKGSWRAGEYTLELVFMDKLLAVVPFIVGDEFVEGYATVQLPNTDKPFLLMPDELMNQDFDEVLEKLNSLIGLVDIKQKVKEHAQYIQFLQLRKDKGFAENHQVNVHSVFTGNPGTGKTTVAKMMGVLYKKMGLLSKGHVHEVDRVDLVGEYIGQTAPKVKEAIEKARGGVLFVDEAYALARAKDDTKDFGREVIEILVKEMSSGVGDLVVIVAGYPKEMKYFLDSNPGLKSRFKMFYQFSDYLPRELSEIAEYACHEKEVNVLPDAKARIDELIIEAYRNRDKSFGNARFVYDLIEKTKVNLGLRVMKRANPASLSKDDLSNIRLDDLKTIELKPVKRLPDIPVDDKYLDEALRELDDLIGIKEVKKQIKELVKVVRYHREDAKDVLNKFFFHTVFVGNPGTGKTTVARILAKIYKALGILERGHMIETDRQGLVAGFMGQTAIKTAEKIDEAMGGVLFVDEAYTLGQLGAHQSDYGYEAIQTILKRMEDHRGQFFVFAAGYPENMDKFLKANPGLSSRFDKVLKFEDYQAEELLEIAKKMIIDEQLKFSAKAIEKLTVFVSELYLKRDKYFGNARTIRQFAHDVMRFQQLRLASLDASERTKSMIKTILPEDIELVITQQANSEIKKQRISFGSR